MIYSHSAVTQPSQRRHYVSLVQDVVRLEIAHGRYETVMYARGTTAKT
jgi:hypothetical protein